MKILKFSFFFFNFIFKRIERAYQNKIPNQQKKGATDRIMKIKTKPKT